MFTSFITKQLKNGSYIHVFIGLVILTFLFIFGSVNFSKLVYTRSSANQNGNNLKRNNAAADWTVHKNDTSTSKLSGRNLLATKGLVRRITTIGHTTTRLYMFNQENIHNKSYVKAVVDKLESIKEKQLNSRKRLGFRRQMALKDHKIDKPVNKAPEIRTNLVNSNVFRVHRPSLINHNLFNLDHPIKRQGPMIDKQLPVRQDTCYNCFANDFKIILNPDTLCSKSKAVGVLVLISSSPNEFDQRDAIRQTWGSRCNKNRYGVRCVFVVGQSKANNSENKRGNVHEASENENERLKRESSSYNDIVQIDFIDSYGNLTYKTLSGILWGVKYCKQAKYIMKTDTDMFVNTELLPKLVEQAPESKFVGGYCWGENNPHRDPLSKWYVSYNSYRQKKFPPMCSGTGYIMSKDLANSVTEISRNIPFFHLEDVYIGLCLRKLNVLPVRLHGFSNLHTEFDACYYKYVVMTSHYFPKEKLFEYWKLMNHCQELSPRKQVFVKIPYPNVD